jgi:phosphatidylserine decarboxylase
MSEAVEEELVKYKSFSSLFTRNLKAGARPVSPDHVLVCPADGKVLHLGRVDEDGCLEQIKGVSYQLHRFLGQRMAHLNHNWNTESSSREEPDYLMTDGAGSDCPESSEEGGERGEVPLAVRGGSELYHVTMYLAPGDYHGFHSPASWSAHTRRHFPGELLTVAPWAVRTMPGLFTLNERVLLLGQWQHGFFSFAAVGAYNVGSISLTVDEGLRTNQKGRYIMGQFSDKQLSRGGGHGNRQGMRLGKGQKLGTFQMGSSIVLVFEAPKGFEFCVQPGDTVQYGQPLGQLR